MPQGLTTKCVPMWTMTAMSSKSNHRTHTNFRDEKIRVLNRWVSGCFHCCGNSVMSRVLWVKVSVSILIPGWHFHYTRRQRAGRRVRKAKYLCMSGGENTFPRNALADFLFPPTGQNCTMWPSIPTGEVGKSVFFWPFQEWGRKWLLDLQLTVYPTVVKYTWDALS